MAAVDSMLALRRRLADAPPHDLQLKRALRALIQVGRARKRAGGVAARIRGQADVARVFDGPAAAGFSDVDVSALKSALGQVSRVGPESPAAFAALDRVEELLSAAHPPVSVGPITLQITGSPPGFLAHHRAQLVGSDQPLTPADAALAQARIHGLVLGGSTLSVSVGGARLPALTRGQRAEKAGVKRGAAGAWLPHVDDVGRYSLTPRPLADRIAAVLGPQVIDACAGCGGDAVAAALAGADVVAIERDVGRAGLARRNADALGVSARIDVRSGDARALLPGLLARWPGAVVYVDPPWGGPGARLWTYDALFEAGWAVALSKIPKLVLKLPPAFDVRTLPGWTGGSDCPWRLHWMFGHGDAARVVKLLLATRGLSPPE